MSELTKEYFDQQLERLATKGQVEELAQMVNAGFEDVQRRLDVAERVQKIETTIERKFSKLEEALHIKL